MIGETLERITASPLDRAAIQPARRRRLARGSSAWARFDSFRRAPLTTGVDLSLGIDRSAFAFDPDRRAVLRADLDACYARLYGLICEDLRYILDPASVMGEDDPSETFCVLDNNKERELGEHRTQRLVLAAWDALERDELA